MLKRNEKITRLIFVCTGNICRSPYAHYRAKQILNDLEIVSAGLHADSGGPADSIAIQVSKKFGVDLLPHRTTRFSEYEIKPGDLILVKDASHVNYLRRLGPEVTDRTVLLGSFCRNKEFPIMIADPWGETEASFDFCYRQIEDALEGLKEYLIEQRKETSVG